MLHRSFFPRDLFAELDRLQRAMDGGANIRGISRGYPAMNVGGTAQSVEIFVFAPGIDPAGLDVKLEQGVLTIEGERQAEPIPEKATVHIDERFAGRFRRVVNLPEDADPNGVEARYRDGVLHIRVARRAASQPRRIHVQ